MDTEGAYYYTRPIGVYTLAGVSSLSLIIQVGASGSITWMMVLIAFLWGMFAWGAGNVLWAIIGDIITPYIYSRESTTVAVNTGTKLDITQAMISEGKFNHHSSKVINDHKLWAGGMVVLTEVEEEKLCRYIRERWFSSIDDIKLPLYFGISIKDKMRERGLIIEQSLTPYGETIFPATQLLDELVQE